MTRPASFAELTDRHKEIMRAAFVDNECGSDEYRESQPTKGLTYLAEALTFIDTAAWVTRPSPLPLHRPQNVPARALLIKLASKWLLAVVAGDSVNYAGCDEARPLFEKIFDVLIENGAHPYYGADFEELMEFHEEDFRSEESQ